MGRVNGWVSSFGDGCGMVCGSGEVVLVAGGRRFTANVGGGAGFRAGLGRFGECGLYFLGLIDIVLECGVM